MQHFGHMPVLENRIGREVLRHFAEAGLEAGLRPAPLTPRFRVAHNAGGAVDHAGLQQRPDGQIGGRRIAARIGHQTRRRDAFAAEFGQSIDCLGEQLRLRCGLPCTRLRSSRACAGGMRR